MLQRAGWLLIFLAMPVAAQQPAVTPQKEQPVGLVLASEGGLVRRAGTELAIAAQPGDLVFIGDTIESPQGAFRFLYCPDKIYATLPPGSRILFEAARTQIQQGALENRQAASFCVLPPVERAPAATRYHYGETRTRGLATATTAPDPSPSGFQVRLQALPAEQRDALLAELEPIDRALAGPAPDPAARLARAAVLAKYNLTADASLEFSRLSEAWSGADWTRLLVHETAPQPERTPAEGPGQTYALVVGISSYQRLAEEEQLRFAHADAETFANFLGSPRGGALSEGNITLLTNEQATTAAIRTGVESFLKTRVGRNDTLILFIAAHGTVADTPDGKQAFILTTDSDPQDLAATALPMADIQALMAEQLANVGRLIIYVDVCRAGIIGTIKSNAVNGNVEELFDQEGDLFGFLASRPRELSIESERFGGGHGAFTYFLLRALNGDADEYDAGNRDGIVSVNEVVDYVRDQVRDATRNKQHPVERVEVAGDPDLAYVEMEGILMAGWTQAQGTEIATRSVAPQRPAAPVRNNPPAPDIVEAFQYAIAGNRILPDAEGSAFQYLEALRRELPAEEYLLLENDLRTALEDQGQQVLLRYLTGDQVPQSRADFERGAIHFEAAQLLVSGSLFLEGREAFSRGRMLIFDKRYPEAVQLLERALRLDPNGAYSYNALGIAYLEQSDYNRAVQAFRDASRRAPYWAYPLHNLALSYTEMGDYQAAIHTYETAMALAPDYSYLPYNLGILLQRLNRRRDAERLFQRALALSPNLAETYNALGVLYASMGRARDAERTYREALAKDAALEAARYNLALLLSSQPARFAEAVTLLRQNISQSSDSLPSRLLLAELLARQGNLGEAIGEYQTVVAVRPEYVAARVALAGLLSRSGQPDEAVGQLQAVLQQQPRHGAAYEQLGDIEMSRGRIPEAQAAYQQALALAPDAKTRKAIQSKINGSHSR